MNAEKRKQFLQEMDGFFEEIRKISKFEIPKEGWISKIRKAMGIRTSLLAKIIGISQPRMSKIESGEVLKTLKIETLENIAEALDCDFIYCMIPKKSIEKDLKEKATFLVNRLWHLPKTLFDIPDSEDEAQKQELIEYLMYEKPETIWKLHLTGFTNPDDFTEAIHEYGHQKV